MLVGVDEANIICRWMLILLTSRLCIYYMAAYFAICSLCHTSVPLSNAFSFLQNRVTMTMHVMDLQLYLFHFILRSINAGSVIVFGKVAAYQRQRTGKILATQMLVPTRWRLKWVHCCTASNDSCAMYPTELKMMWMVHYSLLGSLPPVAIAEIASCLIISQVTP